MPPLPVKVEGIPQELKDYKNWVLWTLEPKLKEGKQVKNLDGTDKYDKVPYRVTGRRASSSDPSTWNTFETINKTFDNGNKKYSGIGFEFSENTKITGVDFDHVRNPETGEIEPEALEEIKLLNSYSEVSQSGTGVHVFVKGKVPGDRRRASKVKLEREMYFKTQFFTVNGQHLEVTPETINENQEAIDVLYQKWFKEEAIKEPQIKEPEKEEEPREVGKQGSLTDKELMGYILKHPKALKLFQGDMSDYKKTNGSFDLSVVDLGTANK